MALRRVLASIARPRALAFAAARASVCAASVRGPAPVSATSVPPARTFAGVAADEEDEDPLLDPDMVKLSMEEYLDAFKHAVQHIRGGAPSAGMLDHLTVEAYGDQQPLTALAQTALQGTTLVVRPFDPSTIADIEKAITEADLGLNPSSDGKTIKAKVPKASKEVRAHSLKQLSDAAETTKVNIRKLRHKVVDLVKKQEGVSEDDIYRTLQDLQTTTSAVTDAVTAVQHKKKEEIESS
ncbi:hypothetical protein FNF31_03067 [Cafeteria roenbergensis]|uniref:Ribosome recycling factor domain-containing protein n=1 Tax=Cafeteria roenbergensis TaxID=33653 RepID=A0A5A8DBQ6_CAFRO|nr:hypothetical protein FNF31_03067 [Cafeteria roenbergensis]KAA0169179.1 hypothetical protein FNF28_02304 [Cafeteria roenbergensis]